MRLGHRPGQDIPGAMENMRLLSRLMIRPCPNPNANLTPFPRAPRRRQFARWSKHARSAASRFALWLWGRC